MSAVVGRGVHVRGPSSGHTGFDAFGCAASGVAATARRIESRKAVMESVA
jgi:hypothetical protein